MKAWLSFNSQKTNVPMFFSYKNQSINLLCESIGW